MAFDERIQEVLEKLYEDNVDFKSNLVGDMAKAVRKTIIKESLPEKRMCKDILDGDGCDNCIICLENRFLDEIHKRLGLTRKED